MTEHELRKLVASVKAGRMSRRVFVQRMVGFGLTAPLAIQLLAHAGLAQTAPQSDYKPTKAGGGGALKLLFWQAATLLNPHFAVGAKDQEGARIFYEPLAGWDPDGNLVPVLAAEIPDIENGGVAADGMSVTWKLKKGWSGTMASPSPPTMSYSTGNTPPTRPPPPQRSASIGMREPKRSIRLRCAFGLTNRRRSGPAPLSLATA